MTRLLARLRHRPDVVSLIAALATRVAHQQRQIRALEQRLADVEDARTESAA